MKIVTILGARPQFIKAAALSRAIAKTPGIREIIVHTGQHYDEKMSDIFFTQMDIPRPDYSLEIKSSLHGEMTGRMMAEIEKVLLHEKPDWVIVYGDTNSTLAGALAARKIHLKLAHVEAGLRSFNMKMPEEINRIVTDRISDVLFCPSHDAVANLHREGFQHMPVNIMQVGDIMKDVAQFYATRAVTPAFAVPEKFILATLHRAENTDDPARLTAILSAFNTLAETTPVVIPVHPRTRKTIQTLGMAFHKNLILEEPVGYLEMVYLLKKCLLVITDSGGLQKEAYYFNKYCVTTRDETEWTELVKAGYNVVSGTHTETILKNATHMLSRKPEFTEQLYGDGATAEKILGALRGRQ